VKQDNETWGPMKEMNFVTSWVPVSFKKNPVSSI
jgi:hypothetical protein